MAKPTITTAEEPKKQPTNISNIYSDDEKALISKITIQVMTADGTAEGWSYDLNPNDYTEIAESIFELVKENINVFTK